MQTPAANQDDVYGLVSSLSAAEKSFFKKPAAARAGKSAPLHMRLFDLIADQDITGDTAARQALGMASSAQYSSLKQHLSSEILDAVAFMGREDSPAMRFYFGLMQLDVLAARGNGYLARRLYKKLWALAEVAGCYGWTLQLLAYRNTIADQAIQKQYIAWVEETAATIALHTKYQQIDGAISRQSERLARLKAATPLRFLPSQLIAVQHIMDALLLLQEISVTAPHLHLRYLCAAANATYLLQRFDACSNAVHTALHLIQQHPELVAANSDHFLDIADTAFYNAFAAGDIQRAGELLARFTILAASIQYIPGFSKRWAIIRFNTALKIAHKTANYTLVKEQLADRTRIITYAKEVLPAADALSVMGSVTVSLFVLDAYAEAESLLLEIKELNRLPDREDVLYFSLVFHLLILYEQKAWYRLDSAIEAAYHMLYSRKKLRPFEKELMRFLKHLPVHRGRGTAAAAIRAFLERLDTFRADPVQRLYFLYFNYYDWLQSKLAGISYREYRTQQIMAGKA